MARNKVSESMTSMASGVVATEDNIPPVNNNKL